MKKLIYPFLMGIAVSTGFAFVAIHEYKNTYAEVNVRKDIAVFTDCKPLKEYRVIGNVSLASISMNDDKYKEAISTLINKVKERYPTAEGIIVGTDSNKYPTEVITFK